MVKVKSSFGKVSGTKANTIYYEVNGVTFGRSKPTKMGNPKTEAQMKQRIKMNNILNPTILTTLISLISLVV